MYSNESDSTIFEPFPLHKKCFTNVRKLIPYFYWIIYYTCLFYCNLDYNDSSANEDN